MYYCYYSDCRNGSSDDACTVANVHACGTDASYETISLNGTQESSAAQQDAKTMKNCVRMEENPSYFIVSSSS